MPIHTTDQRLTLDDIADLRAYEREREELRDRIIELKRQRRVHVGPVVTLLFENRDTVRFQVQEMVRAERMRSDDQVQAELDVYNPLIPGPGQLSATLFIELTTEEELRQWLPGLVGIEHAVELRLGADPDAEVVPCRADPDHQAQLTREDVTAAVHYIGFDLSDDQVDRFAAGPVTVAIILGAYQWATVLPDETGAELLGDLAGTSLLRSAENRD